MHRNPLFIMSLSGSVVVALYVLLSPIIKRYLSISWQKTILNFAIFFYLFPLPLFKRSVIISVCNTFPNFAAKNAKMPQSGVLDMNYTINLQPGDVYFGSEVLLMGVFICCMIAMTSFIVARQLKRYFALSQTYRSTAFSENPSLCLLEQFGQLKEELQIKRKVNFVCSPFCKAPITIGVFSPIIVFPTVEASWLDPISDTYILKHELLHVKNRDFLVKALSLVVIALHWYNPICYFLFREIGIVCELDCDHGDVRDFDETLRQRYSNLILDLAERNYTEKERFTVGLISGDVMAFERRISEIMRTKRNSQFGLSAVIILAICLAGSMTAFAYEAPQIHSITNFNPDGEYQLSFSPQEGVWQPPYHSFFTDGGGNIYPIDTNTPAPGCEHQLGEGTHTHHLENSSDGCTVTVEKAWKCSFCSYMKAGGTIKEITHTVCPHEIRKRGNES